MAIKIPSRLSYSALSSYAECGERYKLERGYGLASGTWWATLGGSAMHTITEAEDRKLLGEDVVVPTWDEAFAKEIAGVPAGVEIKASGKVLKEIGETGGPGKKDKAWWDHYGPLYVERWIAWRDARLAEGWRFATMPDGSPGIEVKAAVTIAGRRSLGFIDRVMLNPLDQVVVVDLKSGNIPPASTQLGVYAEMLRQSWGIEPDWGAFWIAKSGDLTPIKDLTRYSSEYIEHQFDMAWRGIEAGVFLPSPSSFCGSCGVRDYCRSFGGSKSVTIPISDALYRSGEPEPEPVRTTQLVIV